MINFVKSVYSGLCIGLGGTAFLSCDNKILGSFLFGLGLFTILNFGFNLFTGKVGYFVNKRANYWGFLAIVWLGNFTGTFLFAKMMAATRYGAALQAKANTLCTIKDGDSPISLLVLGIFCGMLMFIAADGYKNIENQVGKVFTVFLPVIIVSRDDDGYGRLHGEELLFGRPTERGVFSTDAVVLFCCFRIWSASA